MPSWPYCEFDDPIVIMSSFGGQIARVYGIGYAIYMLSSLCSDPFPNLTHFRIVVCDDRSYHIIMCNNNVNNNNTVFIVTTPEQANSFMSSKYANEKQLILFLIT